MMIDLVLGDACWKVVQVEQSVGKDTDGNEVQNGRPFVPQVHVRMLQQEQMEGAIGVDFESVVSTSPGENSSTLSKATPSSPISPLDFGTMDYEEGGDESVFSRSYEISLTSSSDTYELLNCFTNALSDCLQLTIKEAHVFRSTHDDGVSLGHFVVEEEPSCWAAASPICQDAPEEGLKTAVLEILKTGKFDSENFGRDWRSATVTRPDSDALSLRSAVEDFTFGDFTIDFNDLEIGSRIGGGSSGDIHRGTYRAQNVAIKILNLLGDEDDEILDFHDFSAKELLRMFRREVSTMRLARHKNLVPIIGACSCWPKLYIVMELMSGNVLEQTREPLAAVSESPSSNALNPIDDNMRRSVQILRDAARGVDYLHKKGIMHRDLKAANLLVDDHGVVKVCDFGLARPFNISTGLEISRKLTTETAEREMSSSRYGSPILRKEPLPVYGNDENHGLSSCSSESSEMMTGSVGTLKWIAPEVLTHKPYDHKADVYSFGMVIWEVVTKEVPYAGLTPTQAAYGVVYQGLRPIMPTAVPAKLTRLAQQCWHQNPEERPEFYEIAAALDEVLLEVSPPKKSTKSRWLFSKGGCKETRTFSSFGHLAHS